MNKNTKNNLSISIRELMGHAAVNTYTRQTLAGLFRCFVETIIESSSEAVILVKVKDGKDFQSILGRLAYSKAKVYFYSDKSDKSCIQLDYPGVENDEFLIIIADRFSACIYWYESASEITDFCQGFCTLNPYESRQIVDYLQSIAFNEELNTELDYIKQDRRDNEKFTIILRKLVADIENQQRDLICANTELNELHEKTLQSEKLAAIGQLCSTIAHEIRNPLGMLNLYTRIITKNVEKLDSEKGEILDNLNGAANTISNVVLGLENLLNELLDYSKPIKIELIENDFEAGLNEAINLIKPAFEEKEVSLNLDYKIDRNIAVKFDRSKLNQAILNILKNALEVSSTKGKVTVSVEYIPSNSYVCVKVADQGQGILEENRNKIFTPYFSTKKDGTGLGLARAKKIIEAHGGNLTIISTNSKGTIFGLTLPVEKPYLEQHFS